jgi:hypothetical protein
MLLRRVPMLIGMVLGGLGGVVLGVQTVTVCRVSVVRGFFVVAFLVVLGRCAVVLGGVFMMFRGFVMMIDVVFRHGILSRKRIVGPRELFITKS